MEAQTIQPFSEIATCIKCGNSEQMPPPPAMYSGAPVRIPGSIITRYCGGGKEPEEKPEESPDPMAQIATVFSKLGSVHSQVGGQSPFPARLNICAGIGQEHLHKTCSGCGYEWLTALPKNPCLHLNQNFCTKTPLNYRREEFLQHYHLRSNVESTFSMIKRKFGDGLRSKTDTAMLNESLCKILCHNLVVLIHEMHELGIKPTFWAN